MKSDSESFSATQSYRHIKDGKMRPLISSQSADFKSTNTFINNFETQLSD